MQQLLWAARLHGWRGPDEASLSWVSCADGDRQALQETLQSTFARGRRQDMGYAGAADSSTHGLRLGSAAAAAAAANPAAQQLLQAAASKFASSGTFEGGEQQPGGLAKPAPPPQPPPQVPDFA